MLKFLLQVALKLLPDEVLYCIDDTNRSEMDRRGLIVWVDEFVMDGSITKAQEIRGCDA